MILVLFAVFGSLVGLFARALSGHKLSAFMTIWLGIAGSLLGALLMSFMSVQRVTEFHPAVALGSVIGTFAILASGGVFRRAPPPNGLKARGVVRRGISR